MAQTETVIPGANVAFKRTGGHFVSYKMAVAIALSFLLILLVVFFLGRLSKTDSSQMEDNITDLQQNIDPLHYNLILRPVLDNSTEGAELFTFSGEVEIILWVKEKVSNIQLHSRNLNIKSHHTFLRKLTNLDEKPHFEELVEGKLLKNVEKWQNIKENRENTIKIYKQESVVTNEKFIVHTAEPMQSGLVYLLSLQFKGKIEEEASGLYRTKYIGTDNKLRWIIATQFEPNNARQMFPCFDEPAHKALFSITVHQPHGYKTFSNMAIKRNITSLEKKTGIEIIEFNTSPRLPPYLVSIILTDGFVSHNPKKDKHNVWTQPTPITETDHVRIIIPKLKAYYQRLLNSDLPLDKIDFVGIPDYPTRGTESFGLIALEANSVLYNMQNSSLKKFESVSLHVAFHIAQQWFSNMVTPRSWNLLWLREAFASYLAYYGLNKAGGRDYLSNRIIVNEMQRAFYADGFHDAQPLYQLSFKNPKDIRRLNQEIVYTKGGCLIRMLENFIGSINFENGLQEYIKKWYLKTVNPTNVWDTFDESIKTLKMYDFNVSVSQVMQSWVRNTGYPIVTVHINRKNGIAKFTQEPYSMFAEFSLQEWYIPISYTTKEQMEFDSTKPKFWLTSRAPVTVSLNKSSPINTWIIANLEQTGYYRVNYDIITWETLVKQLDDNYTSIPVLSRYQLLDDAFALAHGGHIHYTIPLQISSLYGKYENDLIPWQGLLKHIDIMNTIFQDQASREVYKEYVSKVLNRIYVELTKSADQNTRNQEKEYLLHLVTAPMCKLDHRGCVDWATKMFQQYNSSSEENQQQIIHGDIKGTIFSVISRQGKYEDWEIFWDRIKNPNVDQTEKYYLAEGLASTPNISNIEVLLTHISATVDNTIIYKNIKVEIWIQLARHMKNLDIFLSYLRKFWEPLYLEIQSHGDLLHTLIQNVGRQLSTDEHLKIVHELKNYHISICAPEDKSIFDHVIEEVKFKINLRESHLQELLAWMNNYTTISS